MCCQDAAPVAPIAVRITECEWNQGTGGEYIVRSAGTFDQLYAREGGGPADHGLRASLAVIFQA